MDLRERVVRAVKEEGLSRRQAAVCFNIGISTAILWLQREKAAGNVAPARISLKASGSEAATNATGSSLTMAGRWTRPFDVLART
jgi:hypothetical protein